MSNDQDIYTGIEVDSPLIQRSGIGCGGCLKHLFSLLFIALMIAFFVGPWIIAQRKSQRETEERNRIEQEVVRQRRPGFLNEQRETPDFYPPGMLVYVVPNVTTRVKSESQEEHVLRAEIALSYTDPAMEEILAEREEDLRQALAEYLTTVKAEDFQSVEARDYIAIGLEDSVRRVLPRNHENIDYIWLERLSIEGMGEFGASSDRGKAVQ